MLPRFRDIAGLLLNPPEFWGCSPWTRFIADVGSPRSENPKLIIRVIHIVGAEQKTERSGQKSQMSGERESEKRAEWSGARSGSSRSWNRVVSGLNLPLMAAQACCPALCSLQFSCVYSLHYVSEKRRYPVYFRYRLTLSTSNQFS